MNLEENVKVNLCEFMLMDMCVSLCGFKR